ncbi:MAG: porin [Janthinobacterium lividum]
MKNATISSLTLLSLSLASASALAQNSVTLYGGLDQGIVYQNNQGTLGSKAPGSSNVKVASGTWYGSRFGFRGSEDIGSGTRAVFDLQAGFAPATGASTTSGVLFNRQIFVGLANDKYGTFTAGRQYTAYYLLLLPYSPMRTLPGAFDAHPGDIDSLDTTYRINNSLVYISPSFHGITFGGSYALGGVPGRFDAGSTWSAALQYLNGPFGIAAAVQRINNSTLNGGTWGTTSTSNNPGQQGISSVNQGYQTAAGTQRVAVTGGYAFNSVWDISASYSNVEYIPGIASAFSNTAIFNTGGAVLHWRPESQDDVALAYSYTRATRANGIDDAAQYHQIALSEAHWLSKRTAFYAVAAYQKAHGKTLGATGANSIIGATASIGDGFNSAPSSTSTQVAATVGFLVKF